MLNTIIDEIIEERHAEEKNLAKKTEVKELEQPEKDLDDFVNTLDSFCLSLQKFSSQLANHRASKEIEDEITEESTENNELDDFEHDTRLSLQKCLSLQKSLDQLTKHQAPQEIFEQTPTNSCETITLDKEKFEEYANKVDQMQKAFHQQLHPNPVNSQNLVDPKFLLSETDLKQIKFIQQNPKLHQYYLMMQKCFNEGFMFANMVSHGEITIEEKSKILNYLEKSQEFLGDIPFASLIISQIKNATSQILKAKTIGKQANFSDLVPNSSQIEANLFAEKIARYLIIARESSTQPNEKISTCHEESLSLQNQNRLDKIKEYIKENAKEILAKFDKDISRGFFGNDFSTSQRMAILDFQKACEIIFEIGIPDEIKALPHGDSRSEKIIKQLVEDTLTLSTSISFDATPLAQLKMIYKLILSMKMKILKKLIVAMKTEIEMKTEMKMKILEKLIVAMKTEIEMMKMKILKKLIVAMKTEIEMMKMKILKKLIVAMKTEIEMMKMKILKKLIVAMKIEIEMKTEIKMKILKKLIVAMKTEIKMKILKKLIVAMKTEIEMMKMKILKKLIVAMKTEIKMKILKKLIVAMKIKVNFQMITKARLKSVVKSVVKLTLKSQF